MAELRYLTGTLYNAKIFEWEAATESEEEKLTSLYLMDEKDIDEVEKISSLKVLTDEGKLLSEFCIFYKDICGVLCTETAEDEVTVREIVMKAGPGRELVLVIQALFTLVQSPALGIKTLAFDLGKPEFMEAIEKIMEGAAAADEYDENALFYQMDAGEAANIDTYHYDIRWRNILEELKNTDLDFRYEYADYSNPRLCVKAGDKEIWFMYSMLYEGNEHIGYELLAYRDEIDEAGRKEQIPVAVFKEELAPDAVFTVYEEIERLINTL